MGKQGSSEPVQQSHLPLYISVGIILAIVIIYFFVPEVQRFLNEAYSVLTSQDEERISSWVGQLGFWGPFSIVLGMIVQMFLIIIPSPLLMLVAILAYGKIWGTLLAIFAVLVASSVGYAIGDLLGEVSVEKMIGTRKKQKLESFVERFGAWAVVLFRLIPFLSNDAISFVGGLLGMQYWKFITATLFGIAPLAILMAYFGAHNDQLKNGMIWLAGIGLVCFIGYLLYKKYRKAG